MSRLLVGALVVATAMAGTIYWEMQDAAGPDLSAATPGRSPLMIRCGPLRDPIRTPSCKAGYPQLSSARCSVRTDARPRRRRI